MFKKNRRTLQVSVVKTPVNDPVAPQEPEKPALTPEEMNNIAKEQIQNIAVAVGATIIAGIFASTVKEVTVHTAKTKIK